MRLRGLTLKELIVVIAILVLLAAVLYPVGINIRYRALETKCRANLSALGSWYNAQLSAGIKMDRVKIQLFLYFDPEGQKIRCPLSGKSYTILPADGQPIIEGPGYVLRKDQRILAYCPWHIHPAARNRIRGYNPDGQPIIMGTGQDRWDNPVYLIVYKDGQVKYAEVYQVEQSVSSTQR